MSKAIRSTALFVLALFVLTTAAAMSAKPKPAPKPVVLGTKQLGGENNAKIGTTYTLGKKDPINVRLDSVRYSVEPILFGTNMIVPNADQKLMVLNYTLHNPNPRNRQLAWSTIHIFAVDQEDTNWKYVQSVGMKDSGKTCYMALKPGQKTEVYTAILVPAKGEIPKIVFESGDKLVLRYQVAGKVKPLPAPIADPSDPSGATALDKVPAEMGTFYNTKVLSTKIEKAEFFSGKIRDSDPRKGKRYLVINGTLKNTLTIPVRLSWATVQPKLTDADGGKISWNQSLLYASRDDNINAELEPGQEMRFRWYFEVPEGLGLSKLSISESKGREFVYDLSTLN